ncbi:hypothetical protein PRIPAC_87521 [Pristionchus pacificus]|uniref:Phosphotransferase n=1 Tax=Pristionchus pacificus TaxID=54126 RepID=A0A2A6CWL8_PRIPA|nr:hypothetical protein PRIPAC_87521 [Pristionchus pacificus]|eukprot:PDM82622.1 phosphotransferase [Pristionchus pacificus]
MVHTNLICITFHPYKRVNPSKFKDDANKLFSPPSKYSFWNGRPIEAVRSTTLLRPADRKLPRNGCRKNNDWLRNENCGGCPRYSSKVDIFALGLILTELCTKMTTAEMQEASKFDWYPKYNTSSDFSPVFKPIKFLGRGAYGCVFEAESKLGFLEVRRAIKRIAISRSEEDMGYVLEPARIKQDRLARHKGIVKYYDAWIEKPPPGWQYDNRLFMCTQEETGRTRKLIRFLAKFKPIKLLGKGTYGCVFEAEKNVRERIQWTRAVKRIPLQGSERDIQKTLKEVEVMLKFDHPSIVKLYNAWEEQPPDGWQRRMDEEILNAIKVKSNEYISNYKDNCAFLYIEMELCDTTLADWLSKNTIRDMPQMTRWFKQIVSAVGYIHDKKLIHRDLKPRNILLYDEDVLKVCDLGIVAERAMMSTESAQEIESERTSEQGTPMYMAPEQGWGNYTSKVDIFALGLILTEMYVPMTEEEAEKLFGGYRSGNTAYINTQSRSVTVKKFSNTHFLHQKSLSNPKMRDDANLLKFTVKESLPKNTYALQLENGIVFYIKMNDWELSVKLDDDETEAKLPDGFGAEELSKAAVHENGIYFEADRKIYKVAFTPPGLLRLSYLRDQLEGEHLYRYAMCARTVGISDLVYRLCDNPNRDALVQDLKPGEKEGLVAVRIHRKKLIYIMQNQDIIQSIVITRSVHAISIQIPHLPSYESSLSQDSSPYFYIANKESLFTINTDTLEVLPTLKLGNISFQYITGVFNGIITLMDNKIKWRLISAQLPDGFFDKSSMINKIATEKRGFFDFLFRRKSSRKNSDTNNNSQAESNGDGAQSTATLEKMAEPIYLAWKQTVKMEFEVKNTLGEGEFVFEALNRFDRCRYAVKRIAVDSHDMDRIVEEVCLVSQLHHPGIVRFCGTWTERPPDGFQQKADYYKILKNQGPAAKSLLDFSEDDVFIYIQMTVSDYLIFALQLLPSRLVAEQSITSRHSRNEPCNILIDNHGQLKLCGLGIATERKTENGEETISRKPVCSLLYLAPEQSDYPPRYTAKTDVFALGLILTELCVVIKNDEERYEIFDRYREGDHPNHLFQDVETPMFTNASPYSRWKPREMRIDKEDGNALSDVLEDNVTVHKLMNGNVFSRRVEPTFSGSRVYFRHSSPQELRWNNVKYVVSAPEGELQFAGEVNNELYFYVERNGLNEKSKIYNFHKAFISKNGSFIFKSLYERELEKQVKFALQQPYFLVETEESATFESFEGDKLKLSNFAFAEFKKIESYSFSIYGQDNSLMCMVCGRTLLIFMEDHRTLRFQLDRSDCQIGGVSKRRVFLNVPNLFFTYDLENELSDFGLLVRDQSGLSESLEKCILGEGGFGSVFHAIHNVDDSEYAVKRIPVAPEKLEKVLGEVRTMSRLKHFGIVRYHNSWKEQPPAGWQYEADYNLLKKMERKEEEKKPKQWLRLYNASLAQWLKINQGAESRAIERTKPWFKQIVDATHFMHSEGVIHRDLKPRNILIDYQDELKICDFGLATECRFKDDLEKSTGRTRIGSWLYASPEQSSSFAIYSSKTDVFALGLILAELCIVMSEEDRAMNFDSYRNGKPPNGIFDDEETAEFVAWIADRESKNRPTCAEILKHSFLRL